MKFLNNSNVFWFSCENIDDVVEKINTEIFNYIEIMGDTSFYLEYEIRCNNYQFIVELQYINNHYTCELYYIDDKIHEYLTNIDLDMENKQIINKGTVKNYICDVLGMGVKIYGLT